MIIIIIDFDYSQPLFRAIGFLNYDNQLKLWFLCFGQFDHHRYRNDFHFYGNDSGSQRIALQKKDKTKEETMSVINECVIIEFIYSHA